ncbi:DNA-binding protein D-ETS-4-like isoform X1 [Argonauta hians]
MPQSHFAAIELYQTLTQNVDCSDLSSDAYLPADPVLSSFPVKLEPRDNSCLGSDSYGSLLIEPLMPQGLNPVSCLEPAAPLMNEGHFLNLDEIKQNMSPSRDPHLSKTEPFNWSEKELNQWLNCRLKHYNISYDTIGWISMTGAMICSMEQDELEYSLGNKTIADIIYNDLQKLIYDLQISENFQSSMDSSMFTEKSDHFRMLSEYMNMVSTPSKCLPLSSPETIDEGNDSSDSLEGSTNYPEHRLSMQTIDKKPFEKKPFETQPLYQEQKPVTKHKQHIHLWQFLKELLLEGDKYVKCIKWLDPEQGVFKIEDSNHVARLWGERKNRPAMNYDKLSRSIRQYYHKGIIRKTEKNRRLVYKFCPPYL